MKAVLLTAYGDVNNLELQEVPEPETGPGEVKVRVAGAGINPVDWKLRSGALQAMMPLHLPAVLGRDVSGTVVELGSGVTRWKVGARVMGLVMGGYAEAVVANADAWTEVPDAMNLVDAAALPLVLLTGAQLIEEALNPRRGDVLLVTGATGAVGRVAVFSAKARGAQVWAGVRCTQKAEAWKLGADGVVALDDEAAIDGLPVFDAIADTVGGPTITRLLARVRRGGMVASVVGEPAGAKERGLVVHAVLTHADPKRLAALAIAVSEGKLSIPIARRLPLSMASEAQDLARNHAGGKVILTATDTPARENARKQELAVFLFRDCILKLLSDEEVARVSMAETAPGLPEGGEYVDLTELSRGVLRADGMKPPMGHVLPRSAVSEATWDRIVKQLAAPGIAIAEIPPRAAS